MAPETTEVSLDGLGKEKRAKHAPKMGGGGVSAPAPKFCRGEAGSERGQESAQQPHATARTEAPTQGTRELPA